MDATIEAPKALRTEGEIEKVRKALIEKSPTYRTIVENPFAVLSPATDDIPF